MLQRKSGRMGRGLGVSTGWVLRLLLAKRKVAQLTGVAYRRIDDAGVHITVEGEERVVPADTVVVCAGQEPARSLYDELAARGVKAHIIGGAERAAELDAMRAIDQGTRLAYTFGRSRGRGLEAHMTDRYAHYKALKFARPRPRILEVILSRPGKLNALDADGHRELAEVWRDIDRDPDTSVALLRGEGGVFSAGGDLGMIEVMARDWATRTRVWKEASDLVYNVINCTKPIVAAIEGPCVGAGLAAAMLADITVAGRKARIIDGHTRLGVAAGDHSAIVWPLLCGMAKAKYYLLLCETLSGEEAERIGLVSMVADDGKVIETALAAAEKLRDMPPAAVRWTKHALNNWLRMAGPTFDASLAMEFMGFSGPEVQEGMAALREKRRPKFDPKDPF